MSASLSKREINRQRWFERIQDWEQSALTPKAFGEQHHLALAADIHDGGGITKGSSAAIFLLVNVMASKASSPTLLVNDSLRSKYLPMSILRRLSKLSRCSGHHDFFRTKHQDLSGNGCHRYAQSGQWADGVGSGCIGG